MLKGKSVLVTGCCGTIGKELVKQLSDKNEVKHLIGIDNNESEIFFLEQRYASPNTKFFLADVRDRKGLVHIFENVDIVFHTAAYKHVILCERSPSEAVKTNINGVENVIFAAKENNVKKVIFTSSDKAVNPTNVMGTSKLMGERLISAASSNIRSGDSVFASTRFGNVLGSRGSVIPIFRKQIRKGGPITLTDPNMTRFIMSIKQAVQLVIDSAELAHGGEVFVTKMPIIRIKDLAEVMIQKLAPRYCFSSEDIEVKTIGSKPGEKMYEELMTDEEMRRIAELPRYYVLYPAFTSLYRTIQYTYPSMKKTELKEPYNSSNGKALTKKELEEFLDKQNLLEGEDDK